ncbi:MAG TPA: hypothetical protein VJ776_05120 [Thermoanaerobaculia bacterium]|nr:hypothetical protein [Thermoanaerobaculia bacterium]
MSRIGNACLLAIALAAPLVADSPSKTKTHGYPLSGTIAAVDEARKTFVVKSSGGKDIALVWTAATTMVGGKLKVGEKVTLRYLDRNGKHIATTVSIGEATAARTPTPSATPGSTPTGGG